MKKLAAPAMALAIVGGAGVSMIQSHEGLRTKAYLDPVGIPTVCYGHTGPDVSLGQTYTPAQCEAMFDADVVKHNALVDRCVKVPLTRNQRAGVVSFTFNVGGGAFCKSTMARKLNRGDYLGAADEFPKWKYATSNGRRIVLRGLERRRADERALFLTIDRDASVPTPEARLRAVLLANGN